MATWQVGSEIGPYLIQELLQSGGVGTLWRGVHTTEQRTAWLYHIVREELDWLTNQQWTRFQEQAEQLPTLSHPHLLQYKQSLSLTPDQCDLIAELPGYQPENVIDLRHWLQHHEPDAAEVWGVWQEIVKGLQYLHARGWIHGALHPEAITLAWEQRRPHARLGHVGLFHLLPPPSLLTSVETTWLHYLAPEAHLRQSIQEHPSTDMYALGAVLWFLLTGTAPLSHWQQDPRWEEFPPHIQEALQRTLATNPGDRASHCRLLLQLAEAQEIALFTRSEQQLPEAMPPPAQAFHRSGDTLPYVNDEELPKEDWYNIQLQHDIEKLLHASRQGDAEESSYQTVPEDDFSDLSWMKETMETTPWQATPPPPSTSPASTSWSSSDPDLPAFEQRPLPEQIPVEWEQQALREDQKLYRKANSQWMFWITLLCLSLLGYLLFKRCL